MNRDQKLARISDVNEKWLRKFENTPGFDPDNPTLEQSDEQYRMTKEEFGQVGTGAFADAVAKMSEEELADLRKLPIYQKRSVSFQ
jgi:hypothetical protein